MTFIYRIKHRAANSRALHLELQKMDMFNFQVMVFVVSTLMLLWKPCFADVNEVVGHQCSGFDNTTLDSGYQADVQNLINLFTENVPINDAFYRIIGDGNHLIHGLAQCRGDLSSLDCADCIRNITMVRGCADSINGTIWLRWCFLRYSNVSFVGTLDQSAAAIANDTDLDDPNVVSKGSDLMSQLASTTPNQPFMFQTQVLDAGQYGKRYGMAQCTRDISVSDCRKCLVDQLATFRTTVENKSGWEIYGSSCSMWYHDYQFYFNYTIPTNEAGVRRYSPRRVAIGIIFAVLASLATF